VSRIDKHKNQYNPPADAATVAQQRIALQYYEGIYVIIFLYLCLTGCSLRFTCRGQIF
jgi:hypothetical protein